MEGTWRQRHQEASGSGGNQETPWVTHRQPETSRRHPVNPGGSQGNRGVFYVTCCKTIRLCNKKGPATTCVDMSAVTLTKSAVCAQYQGTTGVCIYERTTGEFVGAGLVGFVGGHCSVDLEFGSVVCIRVSMEIWSLEF